MAHGIRGHAFSALAGQHRPGPPGLKASAGRPADAHGNGSGSRSVAWLDESGLEGAARGGKQGARQEHPPAGPWYGRGAIGLQMSPTGSKGLRDRVDGCYARAQQKKFEQSANCCYLIQRMKKLIALLGVVAVAFAVQAGGSGCTKDQAACNKAQSTCTASQAKKSCPAGAKDVAKKPVQSPKAGGQS